MCKNVYSSILLIGIIFLISHCGIFTGLADNSVRIDPTDKNQLQSSLDWSQNKNGLTPTPVTGVIPRPTTQTSFTISLREVNSPAINLVSPNVGEQNFSPLQLNVHTTHNVKAGDTLAIIVDAIGQLATKYYFQIEGSSTYFEFNLPGPVSFFFIILVTDSKTKSGSMKIQIGALGQNSINSNVIDLYININGSGDIVPATATLTTVTTGTTVTLMTITSTTFNPGTTLTSSTITTTQTTITTNSTATTTPATTQTTITTNSTATTTPATTQTTITTNSTATTTPTTTSITTITTTTTCIGILGACWTEAPTASWNERSSFTSVVNSNLIWVIGDSASVNDVWYTSNGQSWTRATAMSGWSRRINHSSVDYANFLWVLGGSWSSTYNNEVWFSFDGATWTQATPVAPWDGGSNHTSVK